MNRASRRQAAQAATPDMLCAQGVKAQQAGRMHEAEQAYRQALKAQPRHVDALQLLGLLLYQGGKAEQGMRLVVQSLEIRPEQAPVWFNLAMMHHQRGDITAALAALDTLLELVPGHEAALRHSAGLLSEAKRYREAAGIWQSLAQRFPATADYPRNAALCLKECGDYDAAFALLEQALTAMPQAAALQQCMASLYREVGQRDKACLHYQLAIQSAPQDALMHYQLSLVTRYQAGDAHIVQMEALLPVVRDPLYLHFALGKAYEEAGDTGRAFVHYHQANALKRATYSYKSSQTHAYFAQLKTAFADAVTGSHTIAGPVPVFIVGMPRSGSSLVEQVLASHSKVQGAGELPHLHAILSGQKGWPEKAADWSAAQWEALGEQYFAALSACGDAPFICDKMPMNAHYIGAIRRMLPQAKIIHIHRHPAACCLSIYKRLFFGAQPYAYDMRELGDYYRAHQALMTFWQERHGDAILDVGYEMLVREGEPQMRRLLAFCGLEWEASCARFHESKRAVTTASADQVRRPLYQDAIDSWRTSAPYSGELLAALQLDAHD